MNSATMNLKDLQSNVKDWLHEQDLDPAARATQEAEMLTMNHAELVTTYPFLNAD